MPHPPSISSVRRVDAPHARQWGRLVVQLLGHRQTCGHNAPFRSETRLATPLEPPTIAAMGPRLGFALASLLSCACAKPAAKLLAPPPGPSPGPPVSAARLVSMPRVTGQVRAIDADPSRNTFVTATAGRLEIIRDGEVRSWPMGQLIQSGACGLPDATLGWIRVGISADGKEAWFLGMDGSKLRPNLILSAACLVDAESGTARSLQTELGESWHLALGSEPEGVAFITFNRRFALLGGDGRSRLELVWRDSHLSESIDMGALGGECVAVAVGMELMVACVLTERRIRIARFDVSNSPHRFIMSKDVSVHTKSPVIRPSADGQFLAFHEAFGESTSFMGVIDTADGHLRFEVNAQPPVSTVEFVTGADALLVLPEDGPLLLLGVDGRVQERFQLNYRPNQLFALPGRRVLCDGYLGLRLYAF